MKSAAKVWLWRRVLGFACIADGIGHLVGLRFSLGVRAAKNLARARHGV